MSSSSASSSHAFRYEPTLCTLTEGQTLAQWRDGADVRTGGGGRRARLRDRLVVRRATARLRSAR
jgi:hypothetical protein